MADSRRPRLPLPRVCEATPPAQASPASDDRPAAMAFGDGVTARFGADPGKSYQDFVQAGVGSPRPALSRGGGGDQRRSHHPQFIAPFRRVYSDLAA
jgi:hypothetical protein